MSTIRTGKVFTTNLKSLLIAVIGAKPDIGLRRLQQFVPVNKVTGLTTGIWVFQSRIPETLKSDFMRQLRAISWQFPEAVTVYMVSENGQKIEKLGL